MEQCHEKIPKRKIQAFKFLVKSLKRNQCIELIPTLLSLLNPCSLLTNVPELNIPDEIVNRFTFTLLKGLVEVSGFWALTQPGACFVLGSSGYTLTFSIQESIGKTEQKIFTQGHMILYQKLPSAPFSLGTYPNIKAELSGSKLIIRNLPENYLQNQIGKYVYPSTDNGKTYRLVQVAELVVFV